MTARKRVAVATSEKLSRLADVANSEHHQATRVWREFLNHARRAGEALHEVKQTLHGRGRWGRWLTERFEGSHETARVYIRVAKDWDHPRIQEAFASGVKVRSINAFLKVMRGDKLESTDAQAEAASGDRDATLEESLRWQLREYFAASLRELHAEELAVLEEEFTRLWVKLDNAIARKTLDKLGHDRYLASLKVAREDAKGDKRWQYELRIKWLKQQEAEKAAFYHNTGIRLNRRRRPSTPLAS